MLSLLSNFGASNSYVVLSLTHTTAASVM